MEEKEIFAKLFNSITIESKEHIDAILLSMRDEDAKFLLIQAVKHAYTQGVYTLGESEIISKSIRVLSETKEKE